MRKKLSTDFNEVVKLEVGGKFDGIYLAARTVQTDLGDSLIYSFKTKDKEVDIWATGQLKQFMSKISVGQHVYLTRLEDQPSPNYPQTKMKTYSVEIEI